MSKNQRNVSLVLVVLMLFALALPALAKDDLNRAQWCEGVTIRFFAGGNEAIMPLAAEAAEAGIIMMYQNVDVDQVRARYGGGYVGAQLESQGRALGEEALRQFGLGEGDKAIVLANLAQRERALRALGVWEVLEEAGVEVIHVDTPPTWAADPNLGIPSMAAAITSNPDVKLVAFSGGQTLGNTGTYF